MIHILINNKAHESVGGQPTKGAELNLSIVAKSLGYRHTKTIYNLEVLKEELDKAYSYQESVFIEIICSIKSRADLGRPTTTPLENKEIFIKKLKNLS